jgi:DNA replication protein DnaC
MQEVSGLSDAHRLLTLDMIDVGAKHPRTAVMVKVARMFISNPFGFVSFHGPYGNGKTTALMAIVNACSTS